jgi:hypothetical protein
MPCFRKASTKPICSNPFGPVSGGSLVVEGFVANVRVKEDASTNTNEYTVVPRDGTHPEDVFGVIYPDVLLAVELTNQSCDFLLLFMSVRTGTQGFTPIALLVKPLSDDGSGFTRVGLVECSRWIDGWNSVVLEECVTIM